jgi:hypothetical protein
MERRMVPIERMRFAAIGEHRHGIGILGLERLDAVLDRRHPTRTRTLRLRRLAIVFAISG